MPLDAEGNVVLAEKCTTPYITATMMYNYITLVKGRLPAYSLYLIHHFLSKQKFISLYIIF